VPFVVASVDRGTLGQLRPGASVRLEVVTVGEARAALLDGRERMRHAAVAVASMPGWEGLADAVG
jgi:allophanate hydrolase subunit 2